MPSYCSAEYCPRIGCKVHFRLTCVRLKTSLLKHTIKMLKPFYLAFPALLNNIMQNVYLPFCFSLDLLNLREGAWISDNPVHARRLYIPWFIKFSSLSNTCHAVYSVISIIHLHLISTDFTRKMRREYSAMHFLHVKGGGGTGHWLIIQ